MSKDDIRNILKETGRGMSLEELTRVTGLAKTTVLRNANDLWRGHEVSRMYRLDEVTNIRYVYYYYGSRMPQDNERCLRKDIRLKV